VTKKLTCPLVRDSGLVFDKKKVLVSIRPSKPEEKSPYGYLEFQSDKKKKRISLQRAFLNMTGIHPKTGLKIDLIDLSILESRIMIQSEDIFSPNVKGHLFQIVRQLRDELRASEGMPPIIWRGSKPEIRRKKK